MFLSESENDRPKFLSLKRMTSYGTPEYFHQRNTLDLTSIGRAKIGPEQKHNRHKSDPNANFQDFSSKMGLTDQLTYPTSRSPTIYSSPQLSQRSGTMYGSTKSATIYGSPQSSPRSSTTSCSHKLDDSIHTISEQIDTSEDDTLSTTIVNDISERNRRNRIVSLPNLGFNLQKPKEPMEPRNVILIRDGRKSYGRGKSKKEILSGMDMTIKEGSIYGLLGASGCGKTTLLSCLVGLKNLDKKNGGQLYVFGGKPGNPKVGIPGKRVGYMPQELALYTEFTIGETLRYFGRIYGMDSSAVELKGRFLINLLDLPTETSRLIRNLSGGQQRRVSFAASLLHSPELLILDEPTVGVDPMLRQSIWNYLTTLSTDTRKTTIIITTHYIEEARQASMVGLMRHGRLLAEECPTKLLQSYKLNSLEEVFLKLCIKDDRGEDDQAENQDSVAISGPDLYSSCFDSNYNASINAAYAATLPRTSNMSKKVSPRYRNVVYPGVTAGSMDDLSIQGLSYIKYPVEKMPSKKLNFEEARNLRISRNLEQQRRSAELKRSTSEAWATDSSPVGCCGASEYSSCFSFDRLRALMVKNLIKMFRNPVMLLFVFLLPAVQVVFFCIAIGRDPSGLVLAVVNSEAMANSTHHEPFLGTIDKSYFDEYCPLGRECLFANLSCRYLSNLMNDSSGKISILKLFGDLEQATNAVKEGEAWGVISINSNFSAALLDRMFNGVDSDATARNESKIKVQLDTTNQQINYVLQRTLSESYNTFLEELLTDCSYDTDLAKPPLEIGKPIYGTAVPNFTDFMAPGIILLIIFFLAVALTGEAFILEKKDGLLDRSKVAGVSGYEIMFAQVFTQFLVLVGQTAIVLIFTLLVFSVPCNGPVIWVIILTLLQGTAGMCFGFLISILCTLETTAMQVSIGSFYPVLLLSGILWPIEGMPQSLQVVSWYLPCTCACQAMRDIMGKGWGVEGRLSVQLGLISSAAWIAIFLIVSIICIKIQQRSA